MKRLFAIIFAVFIFASLLILPVAASAANSAATTAVFVASAANGAASGANRAGYSNKFPYLASLKVQCQLGEITLYLPYGIGKNALLHDGDTLRNMTDSTIYFYCPEFPDYVFSASRYSPVTYRESNGTNYQTVQLIVSETSVFSEDEKTVLFLALGVIIFLMMCLQLWGFVRRV